MDSLAYHGNLLLRATGSLSCGGSLGYEYHYQQNLKTMRGAKSNALLLRGMQCQAACPCVAREGSERVRADLDMPVDERFSGVWCDVGRRESLRTKDISLPGFMVASCLLLLLLYFCAFRFSPFSRQDPFPTSPTRQITALVVWRTGAPSPVLELALHPVCGGEPP